MFWFIISNGKIQTISLSASPVYTHAFSAILHTGMINTLKFLFYLFVGIHVIGMSIWKSCII